MRDFTLLSFQTDAMNVSESRTYADSRGGGVRKFRLLGLRQQQALLACCSNVVWISESREDWTKAYELCHQTYCIGLGRWDGVRQGGR